MLLDTMILDKSPLLQFLSTGAQKKRATLIRYPIQAMNHELLNR
jgi:hypothetical protein